MHSQNPVLYRCLFPAWLSKSIQTLFTPVSAQSRWHSYTSKEGEHTWRGFVQPDVFRLTGGETLENALLHLSMIKLHEMNRLNSTGLLQAVTATPAVSFSQHKHWLRLWIGTSPCWCRHNGLGLFSLPLRFLLLLQVFACHAKIQHNDSCHLQAQWGRGCSGKSAVERREQTLLFRIAHLFSHLKDISALN